MTFQMISTAGKRAMLYGNRHPDKMVVGQHKLCLEGWFSELCKQQLAHPSHQSYSLAPLIFIFTMQMRKPAHKGLSNLQGSQ